MIPIGTMTQPELAAYIQSCLKETGIDVVLSGGASVSFYTSGRYASFGIDLVNSDFAPRSAVAEVMVTLGFKEKGRHFTHPDTQFLVEFPGGPLAVGREPPREVHIIPLRTGYLAIL